MKMHERFLWSVLSGALATTMHYLVMLGLLQWTNGARPLAATTLGALIGMVVGYRMNARFAFSTAISLASANRYAIVSALALIGNAAMLALLTQRFGFALWPSQLLVTVLVFCTTFLANLHWSFACHRHSLFPKA